MSTACRQFHADLTAYIERRLPPHLVTALEQHWLQCPDCEAEITRLFPEAQVRLTPEASAALWQGIAGQLPLSQPAQPTEPVQRAQPARRLRQGLLMAVAAVLMLAVAGLPAWFRAAQREHKPQAMLPPPPPQTAPAAPVLEDPPQPPVVPTSEPPVAAQPPPLQPVHGPPPAPRDGDPVARVARSAWTPQPPRLPSSARTRDPQPARQPTAEGWIPVLGESWHARNRSSEAAEEPGKFPLSELQQHMPIW